MKAEYINPFIKGIKDIFNEVTMMPLSVTGTTLKKTAEASGNVVIMLGITGSLKGTVAINLQEDGAKTIASRMMGGMPVNALDEMAISAISELGNMIMGRVCTAFSNEQIIIDITPPTLLKGDNIQISFSTLPLITVGFAYEDITLNFDIAIHENK